MIGIKDLDIEILKRIEDIFNIKLVNKNFYKLYNDEKLWLTRFFYRYGNILKSGGIDINKFRNNRTWKKYCIELEKEFKTSFPYYLSTIATENKRHDILYLLEKIRNIKNVSLIETANQRYFIRESNIKEGKCTTYHLGNIIKEEYFNIGQCFQEKNFVNGILKNVIEYEYKTMKIKSLTVYSKSGKKIKEEKDGHVFNDVKNWYVDGKLKSEGCTYENKKMGLWKEYDKFGNITEQYYEFGKKTLNI